MYRRPHGSTVAAIHRVLPHRTWANSLRCAMAVGLCASASVAWGQALTVPAGSTVLEAGPRYYDSGTVDGSYTITGNMTEIANLTVGSGGSLISNAGSMSVLYDQVANQGTVTNHGMQSVMFFNVSVLTFANSGTWTNQGAFFVAGPVIAQPGSTLAPGNSLPSSASGSSLGTLTAVGNMQLDAGSISVFELDRPTATRIRRDFPNPSLMPKAQYGITEVQSESEGVRHDRADIGKHCASGC